MPRVLHPPLLLLVGVLASHRAVPAVPLVSGDLRTQPPLTALGGPGGPHLPFGNAEGLIPCFNRSDISWTN